MRTTRLRRVRRAFRLLPLLMAPGLVLAYPGPRITLNKIWEEGEWKVYEDLNPILIERKTWSYRDNTARYDLRATNQSSGALCLLVSVQAGQNGRIDQMVRKSLLLPNHKTDLGWVGAEDPEREWDVRLRFRSTSNLSRCFEGD